ncbi:MAG: ABC transporter ATP-binding protein [Propionibacteriaceae bacterium]
MKIETRDLGWRVNQRAIIESVSVVLEPGVVTGVVGPNGSGKTTLLHVIMGLRKPSSGTILYDDLPMVSLSSRTRAQRVALCEQHPQTHLELTVKEIVGLGRLPHIGHWPGAKDPHGSVIEEAMKLAEVEHLADRTWLTLSGGERQRTQLARAIAQEPEVLMLDEPTNHLDLRHQISLMETIGGLGLTTVAVLHDLDLAAAFCDRLVVMHEGRLVAHGPTAEVLNPELIAEVFRVSTQVSTSDRTRVMWHGLAP